MYSSISDKTAGDERSASRPPHRSARVSNRMHHSGVSWRKMISAPFPYETAATTVEAISPSGVMSILSLLKDARITVPCVFGCFAIWRLATARPPPVCSAASAKSGTPSPIPRPGRVVKNGSRSLQSRSCGIPQPLSATVMQSAEAVSDIATETSVAPARSEFIAASSILSESSFILLCRLRRHIRAPLHMRFSAKGVRSRPFRAQAIKKLRPGCCPPLSARRKHRQPGQRR